MDPTTVSSMSIGVPPGRAMAKPKATNLTPLPPPHPRLASKEKDRGRPRHVPSLPQKHRTAQGSGVASRIKNPPTPSGYGQVPLTTPSFIIGNPLL